MSVSSASSASMALPGLSGYDFTGIVDKLVQAYKLPETRMTDQQSKLQIQKDAWRDVNTRLSSLEKTLTALRDATTWTATKASSSDTSIVSVTTGTNAAQGTSTVVVDQLAAQEIVVSKAVTIADTATSLSGLTPAWTGTGSWNFHINDKLVTVNTGSTSGGAPSLADIRDAINNAAAEVTASVLQVGSDASGTPQYRLSINGSKMGAANRTAFTDDTGILASLGISLASGKATVLDPANPDYLNAGGYTQIAQDATVHVNGLLLSSSSNTIASAIPGITLNLNGADSGKTVTVTVTADSSVAQTAVKAFVDQYNSTQDFIATKLSYDQDTKKTGDLFGDPVLQGIQERLRGMVTGFQNNPTGDYKSLADVGIGTSSDNYGKDAKVDFDTSKFQTAVTDNWQSVANLFGAPYGGVTPVTTTSGTIYAQGLGNIMEEYLHPMVMYQGSLTQTQDGLGQQIEDIKNRIQEFDARAAAYEERMRLKFANLEGILAGLNAQNAWLTNQVNAMTSQSKK